MTPRSTQLTGTSRWVLLFLAALITIWATAFNAVTASAATTTTTAETRVRAFAHNFTDPAGASHRISAGQQLENNPTQVKIVVATGVATNGVGRTAARTCLRSFAGATLVLVADGTKKPIEDIEVGDKVVATDPETGERVTRKVTKVWVHDDALAELTLADGTTLTTTEDHLFWSVTDQTFERADQLSSGEVVLRDNGREVAVRGFAPGTEHRALAYNLSIAGVHTYHVGADAILVHNDCSDAAWDIAMKSFDKHGASMGFKSVDEMGAYVDNVMSSGAGRLRNDGTRFWIDYSNSAIIFRGPNPGVPGSVYRPDNFARAVQQNIDRAVPEP